MSSSVWNRVHQKIRYSSSLSPMHYWMHAPLSWPGRLAGRIRKASTASNPDVRHCRDELRREAAVITTLDELAVRNRTAFWIEVDALVARIANLTIDQVSGDLSDGRNTASHCISIDPPELARVAPEVLIAGLDEGLLDVVEDYLGVPPAFTTVHLRKDIGNGHQIGTRIWHIDTEDHRVVRAIVYLNDVGPDNGPFEYIPLTDTAATPRVIKQRGLRAQGDPLLDDEMSTLVPRDRWRQALGPRGTVAIADNARLFHHGKAHQSLRIALIYTYTSRCPRYPELEHDSRFDHRLSQRQRRCFFVDMTEHDSVD